MKKRFGVLLLAAVLLLGLLPARAAGPAGGISVLFYQESTGRYDAPVDTDLVQLTLDGAALEAEGAPAMVQYLNGDGRTLVPVRQVAERLGATVLWVADTRQVLLLREGSTIVLTLGSATAVVDGKTVDLPGGVPAGVVKYQGSESTMVPLRFVSEQLGATVDWDNATFTASITSPGAVAPQPTPTPDPAPSPSPTPEPSPVPTPSPSEDDRGFVHGVTVDFDAQSVLIATDHAPEYHVLDLGNRVVVDILGGVLSSGEIREINIPVDSDLITAVRYSQHGDDLGYGYSHTVRVVVDLKSGASYAKNLTVEAITGGVLITAFRPDGDPGGSYVPTTPLDPNKSTIVLDAGHGGTSSGAQYEGVKEKDLTLSITKKLEAILLEKGYNVVLTRPDDSTVDLYTRADIANAVEADLFISVHCNASATVPTFQGIYTYYHPSSTRGKNLAQAIQTPLSQITGGIDRGIKDADFVVLRETDMCAVLVETGFMSNSEELSRLCDSAYQEKLAQGIAEGAVRYLNGLK